ncbi:MAG: ABC transporter permease subunit, partial [Pseudorhodobacter sp.]|nr:ABC transporter permease subunit [Frankiaceae bacterium]
LLGGLLPPFLPLLLWAVAVRYPYPALTPTVTSSRPLRILADPASEVLAGLVNSVVIALAVASRASLVRLSAGRALGLHSFRGKRLVQLLLLAPVIVPGLAVTLGIQVYFIRFGLSDTRRGVVLVHLLSAVPYVSLVMSSVYANLDLRLEDQARTLGAGPVQVFLRVTLPAVAPGLAVAALFAFLISWGEYVLTLLVGGGTVKTLPLLLYSYLGSTDTPVAAALGLALVLPPVLLLALTSRLLSGDGAPLAGFGRT